MAELKDSGTRREFATGALRDVAEGKGDMMSVPPNALLRFSVHLEEEGAKKYNRFNYLKGIPCTSFMDSALRHLAKYNAGMDDEDHLAAAVFNIMGMMEMEAILPEMQDIPNRQGKKTFPYNPHSSQKIHSLCDETHTIDVQQVKPAETYPRTDVCPTCKFFVPKDERGVCSGEFAILGLLKEIHMFEGCEVWEPKEEGGKVNG